MVLLNELEMATPGESDSPPATNEEDGASPSSAPQSPAAIIGSPDAAAEDMMPASMTPDPEEGKQAEESMLESAAEDIMTSVDDAAEEVISVIDNAQDAAQEKAGDMMESAMDHLRVEEVIEKAEDMVDSAQNEMQETTQSLGNKVAKFLDGNLRKVKSLLHLNEKTSSEEDMETAKNLSSSTGDLDMASSVRKSRACTIL